MCAARQATASGPALLTEATAYFAERDVRLRCEYHAPPGSRTTSRIAVRADPTGAPLVGMFASGTHDVLPCHTDERCYGPHHPAINAAIDVVRTELLAHRDLSAYDEAMGEGTLRYLQLSVERESQSVQLVLVANAETLDADPALRRFAARLWAAYGGGGGDSSGAAPLRLHSVWANLNPTLTNNILSHEAGAWQLLHASEANAEVAAVSTAGVPAGSLIERYQSGAAFVLPPYVFRQANLDGFDRIVAAVCAAVPAGSHVVEWYAGVGSLGLSVAGDAAWVRCSDVNPPREAFEASLTLLQRPEWRRRVSYAVGTAASLLDDARGADVAIVDPPRKGLDPELLAALCDPASTDDAAAGGGACATLQRLVYVSCGFRALATELDALLAAGWRVSGGEAEAWVLFADANHIETLVVLERAGREEDEEEPQALTIDSTGAMAEEGAVRAPRVNSKRRARHRKRHELQREREEHKSDDAVA